MKKYLEIMNKIRNILDMDELKMEDEIIFSISELEDGTSIYYEGELGVDTLVFLDESFETPVGDGEYVLSDGVKIVVLEGKITEYTPEVEADPEADEEVLKDEVNFEEKYNELLETIKGFKKELENFNDEKKSLEDDVKRFESNEKVLNEKIEKLLEKPEVDSITTQSNDTIEMTIVEKRLQSLDAIRKRIKK